MRDLVIASNNEGKIKEIKYLLAGYNLLSLKQIGFTDEIAEPFDSFEENALVKAKTIHAFCGKNVLADDSGICVDALNGAPGVQSAFFGGIGRSDHANNDALLMAMKGIPNRTAFFKSVICLIWNDEVHYFEGRCNGRIIEEQKGSEGFGYDSVFIPEGYEKTFGELSPQIKNKISHRSQAISKMVDFLKVQTEDRR